MENLIQKQPKKPLPKWLLIVPLMLLIGMVYWFWSNKDGSNTVTVGEDMVGQQAPAIIQTVDGQNIQDQYIWCMDNGGEDITPDFNAPKKCIFDNKIYESKCVSNDKYFVVSKDAEYGSDVLVKYKKGKGQDYKCEYLVGGNDFEVKSEGADYLYALENDSLIIDNGTGPSPRGLIVYNLPGRMKVFEDRYIYTIIIKDNTIDYWTDTSIKATKDNCPEMLERERQGLGSAIDQRVVLNLATLEKTELNQYRCSSRQ